MKLAITKCYKTLDRLAVNKPPLIAVVALLRKHNILEEYVKREQQKNFQEIVRASRTTHKEKEK